MYVPSGSYQVGWGGPSSGTAAVNAGKTTTVAFEPYGMDNSGMRLLVNDGEHNTATVLYESDQDRLDALESKVQAADIGTAPPQSENVPVAADNVQPAAQPAPVVVVENDSPVVVYESTPVVSVQAAYVPPPPAVSFTAGFITGAVAGAAVWGTFHYWNDDWYDHWHDWDDWNDHVNQRISNRDDRMNKRIDDRDNRAHDRIDNRDDRVQSRIDNQSARIDNRGQRLDNASDRIGNRQATPPGGRTMQPRPMPLGQNQGGQRMLPPAPPVDSHLGGVQRGGIERGGTRQGQGNFGGGGVQRGNIGGGMQQPSRPAQSFDRGGVQRGNAGGGFQQPSRPVQSFDRGGEINRGGGGASFQRPERHSVSTPPLGGGGRSFGGGGGRSFGGGGGGLRRR